MRYHAIQKFVHTDQFSKRNRQTLGLICRRKMLFLIFIFFSFLLELAIGSRGDRSYIFLKCLHNCFTSNCSTHNKAIEFASTQPWFEKAFQWTCEDECKYGCMWKTVDAFQKDGLNPPHFYGKWPFIRFLGMQEPASVIFSVLNGVIHLRILAYRKLIPRNTPMYYVWQAVALISMNTWIWSTIFHCRDTPFTEKMDYFCAFSLVLCNVFCLFCRAFGTKPAYKPIICAAVIIAIFIQHCYYLTFVKFDYGYNMHVNLGFGALNMVGWLYWCWKHRLRQKYVWKCAVVFVGLNLMLLLELGEFRPILWVFDAHSLWHASTFPLCYLWYSFIIDDGLFLSRQQKLL